MSRIYFDNAATTPLDKDVLEAMMPYLTEKFGNPSSVYSYGRETRLAIENARKLVAKTLNAHPSEIFFTSGGTEATNTAINGAIYDLGCKHIISSPIEHHATLHTVEYLKEIGDIESLQYVNILENGHIDYEDLEAKVAACDGKVLISLMHANNEIGNMTDMKRVGEIAKKYDAIYHSDTVQTVGHFPIDLSQVHVHFINGAGHKFHGPKGVGILYMNRESIVKPFIHGGSQERNMRAGTENLYGIVGFAKALELATANYETDKQHILDVRAYMMSRLQAAFPEISFNGDPLGDSLYTVLSVSFPENDKTEMLLFSLDIQNICVSGGSACTSGANKGSHVIACLPNKDKKVTLRLSFSKYNTKEEVDLFIEKLKTVV
ncbi:cysteine desulfurase family protein [Polluticaenibacter yanchengensis]|uniref:cysteine desulfurase n=1 Tax=Polluticaenibacter yanchengensis TaxID=3014562 RepID=A0ABT4UKR2_9BACT|nr:cysteine desulfurase family protein [Chitinophagaceae bacterium LY-5]